MNSFPESNVKKTEPCVPTKILIADDDRMLMEVLRLRMLHWHLEPVVACNGEQALEILSAPDAPTIALLDWQMPVMSGVEVCRHMRRNFPDRPLYLVIITAQSNRSSLIEAFEAGADDFIAKPFVSEELRARIFTGKRMIDLQHRLASRKESYERLLGAIRSILISTDTDLTVIHWNQAAAEFYDISPQEAEGKSLLSLPLLQDAPELKHAIETVQQSLLPVRGVEIQTNNSHGYSRYLRLNIDPEVHEDSIRAILILADDVSDQRDLEMQLMQAQKLESIGQLAAGIAHEINTPVQFVSDNVGFLAESFEDMRSLLASYREMLSQIAEDSPLHGAAEKILEEEQDLDLEFLLEEAPKALKQSNEGLEKIARIVRAMKEFSHPEVAEKKPVDINRAIETTLIVARNEWKYVADIETDFDTEMPQVHCLPGEFNQVILNMIINAAQAIGDTTKDTGEKGQIRISTSCDGNWAVITIADTGTGMPKDIIERIFDPFFTTKDVGKGTGQGLAISHSVIVDKHQGTIDVKSAPQKGTTFTIRIPVYPPELQTEA